MKRSRTKLHKFITDAKAKKFLTMYIMLSSELQPATLLQTNNVGTTVIPTQRSARASETTNALVLVRRFRLLVTRKIINPFPVIVRMERNQPTIQNQVSIFSSPLMFHPIVIQDVEKINIVISFSLSTRLHKPEWFKSYLLLPKTNIQQLL